MKDQPEGKTQTERNLERIDGKYILRELTRVLNFDKGILYTIKELFLRPGNTVRIFLQHDRDRLVKPVIFVIFSSLVFVIAHQVLGFKTGTQTQDLGSPGITKAFEWAGEHFGIVNILMGFFIGFWAKLFFRKSEFNIYEIFILMFFTIGMGNLIFTFSGIVESITGFESYGTTFLIVLLYSTWAIGDFFNKRKVGSYLKSCFAYFFGTLTGSLVIVLVGVLLDVFGGKG
ncbi:MAG: DUF3667 domain-containing protein [Cytophagales bacterium]|nr:DUF3667 domain-containing protein [Cytophagales bacterium]